MATPLTMPVAVPLAVLVAVPVAMPLAMLVAVPLAMLAAVLVCCELLACCRCRLLALGLCSPFPVFPRAAPAACRCVLQGKGTQEVTDITWKTPLLSFALVFCCFLPAQPLVSPGKGQDTVPCRCSGQCLELHAACSDLPTVLAHTCWWQRPMEESPG